MASSSLTRDPAQAPAAKGGVTATGPLGSPKGECLGDVPLVEFEKLKCQKVSPNDHKKNFLRN